MARPSDQQRAIAMPGKLGRMELAFARLLSLAIILGVIGFFATEVGDKNPDWDNYAISYEFGLSGFEPLYYLLADAAKTLLHLDFRGFFFLQVLINLAMIGYLVGTPLAALLGCVSLYFYIETNVGVQLRWGLAATASLLALYSGSRRTAGLIGLSAVLIHAFAVIPVTLAIVVRCFERALSKNISIVLWTCAALVLMNYLDSIVYLVVPSDLRYLEYLDSEYSTYKSLASTLYILAMFAMEVLMLNVSAGSTPEKRSLVMLIYLRIAQIASLSFTVISGRLLLYSTLLEVLVMKSQLASKKRILLLAYALLSSAKVAALIP
jgi:hypothetical protein